MNPKIKSLLLATTIGLTSFTSPQSWAGNTAKPNQFWWPEQINLQPLRQHAQESSPLPDDFDYAKAFSQLDLKEVKADIEKVLTTSQPWWPADYGHYGPFFIRMAWHSAGTYRTLDGRGGAGGGQQRFDPLNSWPDNGNLDKARRLLWPVKQKYGRALSWADLMILAGNVSMESMGFKTLGFAGGRTDDWEADLVYWGPETEFLADERYDEGRKLKKPLAAVQMGLIYVNPEGPNGNPDPIAAAHDIRESFGRMAMNDEEVVALIAGGHTFGKAHGAAKPDDCVGKEPAAAGMEDQGFGWHNKCGKGHSEDTITSGLEGAWTSSPAQWTHQYLTNLFAFNWVQTKSPAGATQWIPDSPAASNLVPDAHLKDKRHAPIMFTTDLSLKEDPAYRAIAEKFLNDPDAFEQAFARAWFKLTHRDMGPKARYVGSEVPTAEFTWQDPVPVNTNKMIGKSDIKHLKKEILDTSINPTELIKTAWGSAASYRNTDMRGGANGARIRLAPQKDWAVNDPEKLTKVLEQLTAIQSEFNKKHSDTPVSLADLIVLGGAAAIEQAAEQAGYDVTVPFKPGRGDATQDQTSIASFNNLRPTADAFRNYYEKDNYHSPAELLIDKANLLGLTVPEMTVLIGGMRVLNANTNGSAHGVLTQNPGVLNNHFFVNLLDMSVQWSPSPDEAGIYQGHDRQTNELKWTATPVDLIFGSHAELRALAEYYAANDGEKQMIDDFIQAWVKVMQADRFDT